MAAFRACALVPFPRVRSMPLPTDLSAEFATAQQRVRLLQQQPQAFPHPVERVECIETHISWVLLAGDFAYKLKKPLQLDFLDFSTHALRHAACEEELRINRRTAPGVYLGLVGLVGQVNAGADGAPTTLQVVPWKDALPGAEPVVWMRRFAQDALLAAALDAHRVSPVQIDQLACHVAQFHDAAAIAASTDSWGTAAAVQAPVDDCVAALRAPVASALPGQGPLLAQVVGWCRHQGRALATAFEARRAAGRVRECHGDLHLANIALIDGKAQLFDAIEFNPALRWIDCVADIAFVVMDLAAHGRADLAWRFLNRWLEHTGDYAGLSVLRYYGAYRALVRARVAALRLNPTCGDGSAQAVQALEEYLELAAGFAGQRPARWPVARPAALWLAHGFSGAGKSTHALTLACQRGLVRVRADVERKRLFGLAPNASSDGVPGGIYTAEATFRTHQRLAQVAREVLVAGYSVIVDATLLDRDARALFLALADSVQVPCHILSFEAPLPVLRERVRQRALAGAGASEADVAVLDAQWARAHPLQSHEEAITLHVDTTVPVNWDHLLPP